jgi:type 1 glutamine amidotransferase
MILAALLSTSLLTADRVVVVTATAGFRHDSIPTAEGVISAIAAKTGWFEPVFVREENEMPAALSPAALAGVKVVMFVNTTGEIAPESRAGLLDWIRNGGTFIGVHSASDTWHESAEYIEMLGGEFDFHPAESVVEIVVNSRSNAATSGLESPHAMFEEIYRLKNFDASRVELLLSIDPTLPLAWEKTYGRGRVLYTALGHRIDIWSSPWFHQHMVGALAWALQRDRLPKRRAATP